MTTAPTSAPPGPTTALSGDLTLYGMWDDESYLVASDVPAPFVGTAITLSVTASDGTPAGDLSAGFTFAADTGDVTVSGNQLTFTTPGTWTVTATHALTGVTASLPITVSVDRTTPATIELHLSATTVAQGGSVSATVTGSDAWGNPLGDLTDLATSRATTRAMSSAPAPSCASPPRAPM